MAKRSYQICITYLLSCHNSTAGGGMKESCAGSQERLQTVSAGPGTGAGGTAPFWRHELQRQGGSSVLCYTLASTTWSWWRHIPVVLVPLLPVPPPVLVVVLLLWRGVLLILSRAPVLAVVLLPSSTVPGAAVHTRLMQGLAWPPSNIA